ncbi:FAD dependent oxidoreductase [Granulicella rosea]|uniref:FAD dependent oxidoreductase n=2 Tax=Granulicella rosea TaxID=474952 RepID=A0A239EQC4_9BACT|nr:FAD-dependent oxidoreductase [Granulicella rosea]SNS46112.1 FAD dependent oxidoreductase [Granulicella rosea]
MEAELVVVGGGLAGVCCAITAAREGVRVVLVQDRPVLGGNASSEVRLWVLGATSHMGNNNRWAREGGVIDELLVENMWRNPEGNAVIFDTLMLEYVAREPNVALLLNTAVDSIEQSADGTIRSASGFCSQNQIRYTLRAPLFCDASGDGVVGYLAGADFHMGAEARSEYGELLAPYKATRDLLGHSLYFYSRDTGKPVKYVAPSFALTDISTIPRYRELRVSDSGCRLWWLEYGGTRDTVYETEEIKWELWSVVYGVWNYIKNSGTFPEAETLTLEWAGMIPGKRESRRFLGDALLTQQDVVEQRRHVDAVGFGGWAIDLHPSEGLYSAEPGCTQWHSKGVYQIPYRTMYSRNVPNLFLSGRLLSASHIAFGSTRVMATCAHNGQAVGMAAALCVEKKAMPRELLEPFLMEEMQQRLLRSGQHIPGMVEHGRNDLAREATIAASSVLRLSELRRSGEWMRMTTPLALLVPLPVGRVPCFDLSVTAELGGLLQAELWGASREGNTTPDRLLASVSTELSAGESTVQLDFGVALEKPAYTFVVLRPVLGAAVALSDDQVSGLLTLAQKMNKAVAKSTKQSPPENSGIDSFEFWLPERRPAARNLAVRISPPLEAFAAENVVNGYTRPWEAVNAWMPSWEDEAPTLTLRWPKAHRLKQIDLVFDTDFDHPMESVLMTHPERIMPGCVTSFALMADDVCVAHVQENHQTRWTLKLKEPVETTSLTLQILGRGPALPAIFAVRCF